MHWPTIAHLNKTSDDQPKFWGIPKQQKCFALRSASGGVHIWHADTMIGQDLLLLHCPKGFDLLWFPVFYHFNINVSPYWCWIILQAKGTYPVLWGHIPYYITSIWEWRRWDLKSLDRIIMSLHMFNKPCLSYHPMFGIKEQT